MPNCLRSLWLATCAAAALLLAPGAQAQKVQDETVAATFHKAPLLPLTPQYATYSVEYDFGNLVMNAPAPPVLKGLTYQKTGGDLLLRVTAKGLYVANRRFLESSSNGGYVCWYLLTTEGDFGYELRDPKADKVLTSYHQNGSEVTTQGFKNVRDLDGYMDNAFVGEHTKQRIMELQRRLNFALNPHQYQTQLTLNTVEGPDPAYADINKATAELKALLAAATTTAPDPARLDAIGTVWQQQLARADWDNKKAPINKKVAGALLENLCALSLLRNDYSALAGYAEQYEKRRISMVGWPAAFKADVSYTGTHVRPGNTVVLGKDMTKNVNVSYTAVAADMQPTAGK